MTDDTTRLTHADGVQVTTDGSRPAQAVIDTQERREMMKQNLADRKTHLAEVKKRMDRTDYSPEKRAQYRAAFARASAELKALEEE